MHLAASRRQNPSRAIDKKVTLTITLAANLGIYQSNDFRLSKGSDVEDTSFKSLTVGGPEFAGWTWCALISYSGVGAIRRDHTSQWLFSILKDSAHLGSLDDAIDVIRTTWPSFIKPFQQANVNHTFIIGAFDRRAPRIIMLSNGSQLNARAQNRVEPLPSLLDHLEISEEVPANGSIYATGSGASLVVPNTTKLARLSRRLPADGKGANEIFKRLAGITKAASQRAARMGSPTVSEGCLCEAITPDGPGASRVFGVSGAEYFPPSLRYPLPDSAEVFRIAVDLQKNVLEPQRERFQSLSQNWLTQFATEANQERKRGIIRQSVCVGKLTFNSCDLLGVELISMGPPLQGDIQATTSDEAVATIEPSPEKVEGTGCTPSIYAVSSHNVGSCNLTLSDKQGRSVCAVASVYSSVGKAYIANHGGHDVSVVDISRSKVVDSVALGQSPTAVTFHPNGKYVYVTQDVDQPHEGPGSVAVIDTETDKVVETIDVGVGPSALAINRAGTLLYVLNFFSRDVSVVETESCEVIDWIATGGLPVDITLDPMGLQLFIVDGPGHQVAVVDTLTNSVSSLIPVGKNPICAAVNRSGSHLYVANQGSSDLSIVDLKTNGVAATVQLKGSPNRVAVSPSARRVYVTTAETNSLAVIDTFAGKLLCQVPVGKSPSGLAIEPSDRRVYVVNAGEDSVSVVETDRHVVSATIKVGARPMGFGCFVH